MMDTNRFQIFDNMIEGVQIIDPDFRYLYLNPAVAEHARSTVEALVGTTMEESFPGISETEVFRRIGRCLETQQADQMINAFTFPDGEEGYFQLRMQPIPEGVLLMSFDITAQVRAERAMEELNVLLEERVAQRTRELEARNEELSQITYVASHDLQEPVRTICSYAEILEEETGGDMNETARISLGFIVESATRMQALVQALRDFSRLGNTRERRAVDSGRVLDELRLDFAERLRASEGEVLAGELPSLVVYPAEFRMLLQHLLANALTFTRPDVPPRVEVQAERDGEAWRFAVSDNGIGFDMRYEEKIFRMFQRLHPRSRYPGTGLGLAQCKKIVLLHGGDIWAQSSPGEGARFHFTIPDRASANPTATNEGGPR